MRTIAMRGVGRIGNPSYGGGTVIFCCGLVVALAQPVPASAKIAITRSIVIEVHAPGSARGMKYGAVTLARLIGKKKDVFTAPLTQFTQLTRLGDKDREPISLKDLKPGMAAVIEISGERGPNANWDLDLLHVLGPAEDADPALARQLEPFRLHFLAKVKKVGPPERKGDLGQVEVEWARTMYILRITKRTEIVWRNAKGKTTPAKLDNVAEGAEVWVTYLMPLGAGDPVVAPAMQIILDEQASR